MATTGSKNGVIVGRIFGLSAALLLSGAYLITSSTALAAVDCAAQQRACDQRCQDKFGTDQELFSACKSGCQYAADSCNAQPSGGNES